MSKLIFLFPIIIAAITYTSTRGNDGQLFDFIFKFIITLSFLSALICFYQKLTIKILCSLYGISILLTLPSFFNSNLDGMAGILPLIIIATIIAGFAINLIQILIINWNKSKKSNQ